MATATESTFRFIDSERNGKILLINNYEYRTDRIRGNNHYFKCIEKKCTARAILRLSTQQVETGSVEYNHTTSGTKIAKRIFRDEVKKEVSKNLTTPVPKIFKETRMRIVTEGIEGIESDELHQSIPIFDNLRTTAYRSRLKLIPKIPKKREDITLTDTWTQTNDMQEFLLCNDENEDKILIFGTVSFLQILCRADCIYMDGSFKSCPDIFYQIYTLHCFDHGIMIPCTYALLPNKTTDTYMRMFTLIREAAIENNLQPSKFQIDFESGMLSALKTFFGNNLEIKGCLFHFGQNVFRQAIKCGSKTRYRSDLNFKKFIKRSIALALLPIDRIDATWLLITLEALTNRENDKIIEYMDSTYIGSSAKYDRQIWNHFETPHTRTINHLEGWHFSLNHSINKSHPNLYEFIKELKSQHGNFELELISASNGVVNNTPRKYKELNKRLEKKTSNFCFKTNCLHLNLLTEYDITSMCKDVLRVDIQLHCCQLRVYVKILQTL